MNFLLRLSGKTGLLIFFLINSHLLFSQPLNGVKTVDAAGSGPNNYSTLKAAIDSLNSQGVGTGGVTFNVVSGFTETAPAGGYLLTATGTASAPIVFQKSGAGANPLITAFTGTSTSVDGIIKLAGSDYVTFDGISLQENAANTTPTQQMEWGFALVKKQGAAPFDGCQYVTIKNCNISLNRSNTASKGIYLGNHIAGVTTALSLTAASDANSYNTFTGNTISNVFVGISLNGVGNSSLYDTENKIGASSQGNIIQNYGGGAEAYGVYLINQKSDTVSYNTIDNAGGGGAGSTSTLYGIYHNTTTNSNFTAKNNNITLTQAAGSSGVYGIRSATSGNIDISNNTFQAITSAALSSPFYFIYTAPALSETVNNNNFNNITVSTTGAIYLIYTNNNTPVKTISGNYITTQFTRIGVSSSGFFGIYSFASPLPGTGNIFNNNFSNITFNSSAESIIIRYSNDVNFFENIYGNTISNITKTGTGNLIGLESTYSHNKSIHHNTIRKLFNAANISGILAGNSSTPIEAVFNNTVDSLVSSGASSTVYGINLGGAATQNAYNNKVTNVIAMGATGTAHGIYAATSATATLLHNNMVSNIYAPASGGLNAVNGIYINGGADVKAYYNSIYLDASSSATDFGSSALYVNTTPTFEMSNNIIINKSTPKGLGKAAAYTRSGTSLGTYAAASGHNVFYTSASPDGNRPVFSDGTNRDSTIADYKSRVSPRDNSSIYENVPFLNTSTTPYDLHISTSIGTQVESNGISVSSITTDIDGNTRHASLPDIGADEGTFTPLDVIGPGITYTALAATISTSNRVLTGVTITDASGVDTTAGNKPRLYYRRKLSANTYNNNTSATPGWKYTVANTTTSPFSFNIDYSLLDVPPVVGDTIEYFVIARDISSAMNTSINSGSLAMSTTTVALTAANFPVTGTARYGIVPPFPAAVTVGPGANYNSITGPGGLFDALNQGILNSNVTATVVSSTVETGDIALNEFTETGAGGYTLRIVPFTSSEDSLVGNYSGSLFRFNQADRVIIDGSYNGSGKYLVFANKGAGTSAVFQLISGSTNGCNNITIKNSHIVGGATGTNYGIVTGIAPNGALSGANHDFLTIDSNIIKRTYYGIYINSTTATPTSVRIDGLKIRANEIGSNDPAEYIRYNGIFLQRVSNAQIERNKIFNVVAPLNATINPSGIWMASQVTGTRVNGNIIHTVRNPTIGSGGGYGAAGIILNTSNATSNDTITNNMISYMSSDAYLLTYLAGESSNTGIRLVGTTGSVLIAYNTINLFGTSASASWTSGSANLYVDANVTGLRVVNNIFSNSIVRIVAASQAFNVYSTAPASAFAEMDNNIYSIGGTQSKTASMSGTEYTTLALFQAANSLNVSSLTDTPVFVNDTSDLHINSGLTSTLIESKGKIVATIAYDLDGDVRPGPAGSLNGGGTAPDIGADEFDGVPDLGDLVLPVVSLDSINPPASCSPVAHTVYANISDASGIDTAELYYAVNGGSFTMMNMTHGAGNQFYATIPAQLVADFVEFKIRAVDASANHNAVMFIAGSYADGKFNVDAVTADDSIPLGATTQLNVVLPVGAKVGYGNITNANTTYPSPYANYNYGSKHQFLVRASELIAAGLSAGPITGLTFDVASTNSSSPMENFEIKIDTTSQDGLTGFTNTAMTSVYFNVLYTPVNGINQHVFTTPFVWNGTSNIIVQVCHNNSTGYSNNVSVRQSATSFISTAYTRSLNTNMCGITTSIGTFSQRPNMNFMSNSTVNYTWSQPANGGLSATNIKNPTVTPTTLGIKTYKVTASNGTCNYTDSVKVKVVTPVVPVARFGSDKHSGFAATTVISFADSSLNLPLNWKWTFTPNTVIYVNGTSSTSKNPQVIFNNTGTYTVKMKASNSAGSDSLIKLNHIIMVGSYCPSAAGSNTDEDIGNVKIVNSLGTVLNNGSAIPANNNSSSVNVYTDHTGVTPALITKMLPNTITVKPIWASAKYQEYISVYIDFNQNGVLNDPGELVANGPIPVNADSLVRTFVAPISAITGPTLMRVIDTYGGSVPTGPCAAYGWGETEDYIVNILPAPPGDYYPPDFGIVAGTPSTPQCTAVTHNISVQITDTTSVDSAWIEWQSNGSMMTPIVMTHVGNLYSGSIPPQGNYKVSYSIRARDNSVNKNEKTIAGGQYQDEYLQVNAGDDIYVGINQVANLKASSPALDSVLITDVVQCKNCNAEIYPNYVSTSDEDFIEISNITGSSFNLSGYKIVIEGGVNFTYIVPNGVIIPAYGTALFAFAGTQTDFANHFFGMGTSLTSSGIQNGFVLKNPQNGIVDAVATNGYTFSGASGVTASNWSGNVASSSGMSGITRSGNMDRNLASDWTPSGSKLVTPGFFNPNVSVSQGHGTITWTGGTFTAPQNGVAVTTPAHPALGNYTYKATVNDGLCNSNDSVIVHVIGLPSRNIIPTTGNICGSTPRVLDAGNPGSTYVWKKDGVQFATTQMVAVTSPGIYKVIVTNQINLTDSDSIALTAAPAFAFNAGPDKEMCIGGTIQLDAGTGHSSYLWKKNNANLGTVQVLTVTDTGLYVITVTNNGGCAEDDTIHVTQIASPPTVNLGTDQNICASSPLTLDAGNAGSTYVWKKDGTAYGNTQTVQVSLAGTYSVVLTTTTGCTITDTIVIGNLPAPVVSLGADVSICPGTTTVLNAGNPGLTYAWYKDNVLLNTEISQTLTVSSAGTFVAKVTGGNGCAGFDTIVVTFKPAPVVDLGPNTSICSTDTLDLDAGNPGSAYLWSTGATTQTISVSLAGTYHVRVTGVNGCITRDTIVITNKPTPFAQFTMTELPNLEYQFTVPAQGGVSYLWDFGDGANANIPSPKHQYVPGTYHVVLTVTLVASNCKAVHDTTITITVGVGSDLSKQFNLQAAPNPFKNNTTIAYNLSGHSVVSLEVYDVLGRKVKVFAENEQQAPEKHQYNFESNDDFRSNGIYIVKLTVDGQSVITRLIRTQ